MLSKKMVQKKDIKHGGVDLPGDCLQKEAETFCKLFKHKRINSEVSAQCSMFNILVTVLFLLYYYFHFQGNN